MKTLHVAAAETPPDFDAAIKRAKAIAAAQIGENMLLWWYDRDQDLESPAHATKAVPSRATGITH